MDLYHSIVKSIRLQFQRRRILLIFLLEERKALGMYYDQDIPYTDMAWEDTLSAAYFSGGHFLDEHNLDSSCGFRGRKMEMSS